MNFPKWDTEDTLFELWWHLCESAQNFGNECDTCLHNKNDSLTQISSLEKKKNYICVMCDAFHAKRRHFYFLQKGTIKIRENTCNDS